ncbi:hypothetical protein LF887_07190 [Chryseobacterium sp. MEBOG06]|uniref:hypothetical protein n=1 Tax=Chryseobacterium sp. MEBOG06 TaxID=2879938 RepID=UPI001F356ED4|nr:hypothetical protein [Chryseobacterium sp. MEBOG06]UKB85399.1 hypothetical protein LF887_07190 [Chryseobacterium sp. MEBOG06]
MKKIKKGYYCFYYVLYKYSQSSAFPNYFTASILLGILEILVINSFINYYDIFNPSKLGIFESKVFWILIVFILVLLDYLIFHYKDQWKYIIKEFDSFSKEKNRTNKWIVYSISASIIINFIFSFYLLFAQAKQNQTGPYAPEIVTKERREDSLQKAKQIENLKKIYGEDKK